MRLSTEYCKYSDITLCFKVNPFTQGVVGHKKQVEKTDLTFIFKMRK